MPWNTLNKRSAWNYRLKSAELEYKNKPGYKRKLKIVQNIPESKHKAQNHPINGKLASQELKAAKRYLIKSLNNTA